MEVNYKRDNLKVVSKLSTVGMVQSIYYVLCTQTKADIMIPFWSALATAPAKNSTVQPL